MWYLFPIMSIFKYLFVLQAKDKHGISALLAAIWEGHTFCVRTLLDKVSFLEEIKNMYGFINNVFPSLILSLTLFLSNFTNHFNEILYLTKTNTQVVINLAFQNSFCRLRC